MKTTIAIVLLGVTSIGFASFCSAAATEEKAAYKAAEKSAAVNYKYARDKCNVYSGNPKNICIEEAIAARAYIEAEARAQYQNTPRARTNARIAIASAEYDVAKARCGSKTGNEKDVCIKEAKAAKIAAQADATADRKVTMARIEAIDDKREANYKVAIEKCDGFAGATKENCIAASNAQYAK